MNIRCILGRHQDISFMIKETSIAVLKELGETQILVGIPLRLCLQCGRVEKQVIFGSQVKWVKVEGNEAYKAISRGLSNSVLDMKGEIGKDAQEHLLPKLGVSEAAVDLSESLPHEGDFKDLMVELKEWMDKHKEGW